MKDARRMTGTPQREALPITAYEWCLENVSPFLSLFNEARQMDDARPDYHPMVNGIVWSDEFPPSPSADATTLQQVFCVLVHARTRQILGEALPPVGLLLLDRIREECPKWSFNDPYRSSIFRKPDFEKVRERFFRIVERLKCSSDD